MPQLDVLTFFPQIFWLIVSFIILHVILSHICLPKLTKTMEERDEKILELLASAERNKEEALKLKAGYENILKHAAQEKDEAISKTMAEISQILESKLAENNKIVEQMILDSEKRLANFKNSSAKEIDIIAQKATQSIAEVFFNLKLNESDAKGYLNKVHKVIKYDA